MAVTPRDSDLPRFLQKGYEKWWCIPCNHWVHFPWDHLKIKHKEEWERAMRTRKWEFTSPTVDLHIDAPWVFTKRGKSICSPAQMEVGGLDKGVFALYLHENLQSQIGDPAASRAITAQIKFVRDTYGDDAMMCLEGGRLLHMNLDKINDYRKLGVRYLTLTHNASTLWADSATDRAKNNGLTEFGFRVIKRCNEVGMVVDVSHASDKTFWDALGGSQKPVIATHSGCRALIDHPRNLTDDMIKAIAKQGGVIGVPFAKRFIGDSYTRIAEHIDHIVCLTDIQHVAIGSDLDGAELVGGVDNATDWESVTMEAVYLRFDYSMEDIGMLSGGNAMRIFNQAASGEKAS